MYLAVKIFWFVFVISFASCVHSIEEFSCSIGCSRRARDPTNDCLVHEVKEIWPGIIDEANISKPVGCELEHFTETSEDENDIYLNVSWIYTGFMPRDGFYVGISSVDISLLYKVKPPRWTDPSTQIEAIFRFTNCAPLFVPNWSYTATITNANTKLREQKIKRCKTTKQIPGCCSFENSSKFQVCQFANCLAQKEVVKYHGNHDATGTNWKKFLITALVVILVITAAIVIIGGVLLFRGGKISKLRPRSYAVVLASTGDQESKYRSIANEMAWEIKCSGRYDDVYYNGWITKEDNGELRKAVAKCTVAVIITSPFGKRSYDEFLRRKELSTWVDGFVLGAYSLIHGFRLPFRSYPKIFVVYHASESKEQVDDHLHSDFKKPANYCRNIDELYERQKLLEAINNSAL